MNSKTSAATWARQLKEHRAELELIAQRTAAQAAHGDTSTVYSVLLHRTGAISYGQLNEATIRTGCGNEFIRVFGFEAATSEDETLHLLSIAIGTDPYITEKLNETTTYWLKESKIL